MSRTKCSLMLPRVSSLWFPCGIAVSMGEAAKPLLFEGFQAGCHVVLRGRHDTLWHQTCRKSFCVASAILLRRFRKMICSFRGAAFWRSLSSFCVAGAALHTLHSTLHPPPFTLHTPHSTLYTLHFTLYTPHSPLYTVYTFYTLHSTLYTTLYAPHSTLYTPHSTLHTLHSRLYTPHSTLSTPPSSIFHLARRLLPYSIFHATFFHCSNKLFHESVLRDCISMCFDICAINIRVSIRVRGLHLVFLQTVPRTSLLSGNTCLRSRFSSLHWCQGFSFPIYISETIRASDNITILINYHCIQAC